MSDRTWTRRRLARPDPDHPRGALLEIAQSAVSALYVRYGGVCMIRRGPTGRARLALYLGGVGCGRGPIESTVVELATGRRLTISSDDVEWEARRVDVDELPPALLERWPRDRRGRPLPAGCQDDGSYPVTIEWLRRVGRELGDRLDPPQGTLFD